MERAEAGYIAVGMVVTREGKQYSSWCPELDIASCGNTPEEAVENLGDALELYVDTLKEDGELELVFREKGIRVAQENEPIIPSTFITQYRLKLPTAARL